MFWRGSDVTELLDNKYDNYVPDHTLIVSYHITDTLTLSHATAWALGWAGGLHSNIIIKIPN